ncbi:MAG TPA: hypothetical protein VMV92_16470 [Streptosporangiaceae bacterium]|nr:hypothetical protein [Streptosporangiaceae bacterium]
MPKKKVQGATGNTIITSAWYLMSDPGARYTDLGADYYGLHMNTRRQARSHIRCLERLGNRSPFTHSPRTPANPRPPDLGPEPENPTDADAPLATSTRPAEIPLSDQPPGTTAPGNSG